MKYSLTDDAIKTTGQSSRQHEGGANLNQAVAPSSVGHVLRAVAPYLAADLIAPDHLTHLQTIADQLPNTLTNYFGFECRLGEATPRADILFCVRRMAQQPAVLGGLLPGIPPPWLQEPVWQRAQAFGQQWESPASALFHNIQDLWLEFDVVGPPAPIPIPSIFICSKTIDAHSSVAAHEWLSAEAVRLLTGAPLPAPLQRALFDCIAALPENALLFTLGAMLSREPAFVRICVSRIATDALLPYLEQIGWPGDRPALATLIDELAQFVDGFSLNLDLIHPNRINSDLAERSIGPRIGLDCRLDKLDHVTGWATFLDHLVAQRHCLPTKRAGILDYLRPGPDTDGVVRGLHHIKVVMQPDKALEAKAYLHVFAEK